MQLFSNNGKSTLASAVTSSGQTSLALAAGQGALFPSPTGSDYFLVTLDDNANVEICKCTARSGDTLTVLRGQEGTVAQSSFAIGTKAESRATRDTLANFLQLAGGGAITGNADAIELKVKGNVTQTTNILEVQKSDATSLMSVSNAGLLTAVSLKATGLTSGRIPVAGAAGLVGDFANLTYGSGKLAIADATASTSTSTGALVLSGSGAGLGVAGAIWAGTSVNAPLGAFTTSQDASLGAELITNLVDRDFSGACNWDTGSGTWSIVGGAWTHTAGANATSLPLVNMGAAPIIGLSYQVVVTIVTSTASTTSPIYISYGGATSSAVGKTVGTLTTYTVVLVPTDTTSPLTFTPDATWVGSIDNVSVKLATFAFLSLRTLTSGGTTGVEFRTPGATSFGIGVNALRIGTGADNVGIGNSALRFTTTGTDNTAVGYTNLYLNSSGTWNTAIGSTCMVYNTVGAQNTAVGVQAMKNNVVGSNNVSIGVNSLFTNSVGIQNTACGHTALFANIIGSNNTALGYRSLYSSTGDSNTSVGVDALYTSTGSGNVALGYYAGRYETGSNAFYVDNQNRTNTAGDKAGALLYGVFNATVASQTLTINAATTVSSTTEASAIGTAALVTAGGLSVAKKAYHGDILVMPKTSGKGIQVDTTTPTWGWCDITGYINVDAAGANAATLSAFMGGSIRRWSFSATDKADCEFHIPHDYAPGTDLYIHYHWAHNGTAISGNIVGTFVHTYAKGHNQANFSAEKTVTSTYNTTDITTTPRYRHRVEEVQLSTAGGSASLLDTASIEADGIIGANFTMTTIPTITGGSPNEPFVLCIDLHYQSTNIGTKAKAPDFWT